MIFDKLFKNEKGEYISILDVFFGKDSLENYIYSFAEAHAIDLIAKTISKCEIQTFEKKDTKIKKNKSELYWLLNIQPNYYQLGTNFIYNLVIKLLTESKALIVINKTSKGKFLYLANEFKQDNEILKMKTFSDITIIDDEENSILIKKTYNLDNSIYFSLQNKNLTTANKNFKINISKILKATQKSFIRKNVPKWKMTKPGGQPAIIDAQTGAPISYEEYKNKITEGLISEEEAIILLSEQFNLSNLNEKNDKDLSDFEIITKRICDSVALKWSIPLDIFYGSKTEKSMGTNDYITFGVEPYFELLEDGFNCNLVGKEAYLKGEMITFNRLSLQHRDIFESANGIDKLTADGFSRNEINEFLRLPRIDEEWADEHNITKNYANVKGGGNNEE